MCMYSPVLQGPDPDLLHKLLAMRNATGAVLFSTVMCEIVNVLFKKGRNDE